MAVPNTFTNGTVADADDVNENFTYFENISVPVGGLVSWLKTNIKKETGSATSTSSGKLVDSAATFSTNGVTTAMKLFIVSYADPAAADQVHNTAYSVRFTYTFGATGDFGLLIPYSTNNTCVYSYPNNTGYCKHRYYYTDGTDAYSNEATIITSHPTYELKTYYNPNPTKQVWKVEVLTKDTTVGDLVYNKDNTCYFNSEITISSVDSETQLTLPEDYVKYSGMTYFVFNMASLPTNFVECNGQTLSDADSIFNASVIPDLNGMAGTKRFLRGSLQSSATGGTSPQTVTIGQTLCGSGTGAAVGDDRTYAVTEPSYYEVVVILRVK